MDGTSALFGGTPPATVEVLGRPLALRIADRLLRFGVNTVYVVGPVEQLKNNAIPAAVQLVSAPDGNPWRECENVFGEATQNGAEVVLVQRVGPYLELDYDDFIGFHFDHRSRVTTTVTGDGRAIDAFCISASRRNDAAFLFRHQLQELRTPSMPYRYRGPYNAMLTGSDLRELTIHAFEGTVDVTPYGKQVRPGVWVGEGARIERGARVIAPAFIGAHARLHPSSVVTRFSAIERGAEVECGTVVEDSNVLARTYVGAGLDVAHAIVGNRHLMNLPRKVEIEVSDPKLVRELSEHAPLRAMAALAIHGPWRLLRNFLPWLRPARPASLPAAVRAPAAALKSPALHAAPEPADTQFSANLMVARRYGNE